MPSNSPVLNTRKRRIMDSNNRGRKINDESNPSAIILVGRLTDPSKYCPPPTVFSFEDGKQIPATFPTFHQGLNEPFKCYYCDYHIDKHLTFPPLIG